MDAPARLSPLVPVMLIMSVAVGAPRSEIADGRSVQSQSAEGQRAAALREHVPPPLTVTAPEMEPGTLKGEAGVGRPLKVPPLFTATAPVPVALPLVLFTWRVPLLMVVPPV